MDKKRNPELLLEKLSEVYKSKALNCLKFLVMSSIEVLRVERLVDLFLKIIIGLSVLGSFLALLWGHLEVMLPVTEAGSTVLPTVPIGLLMLQRVLYPRGKA